MALIINGTTIPTSGTPIKVGSTTIDKVNVVKNGVTTTVWQRVVFTTKDFAYTGGMQSVTLPAGLYKLEVWGAQGGSYSSGTGGLGGYSCRYYYFSSETTVYVCVGGQGTKQVSDDTAGVYTGTYIGPAQGGYNGGAPHHEYFVSYCLEGATGGGATHIATRTGILSSLSSYKSSVLVVAGGGGGGSLLNTKNGDGIPGHEHINLFFTGGSGGGLTGLDGNKIEGYPTYGIYVGKGGTQTSGGAAIVQYEGQTYTDRNGNTIITRNYSGSFGKGGYNNVSAFNGGTGGGGWYGGSAGANANGGSPGGGGSGYIGESSIVHNGTTYTNTSTAGQQSGNGKAKITFIAA